MSDLASVSHVSGGAAVPPLAAAIDARSPAALVIGYACALDARDWSAFRALFAGRIELDYGAINSIVGTIDADHWVQRCRALEGFDATLHRITNLRIGGDDAEAVAHSYVDAVHFIEADGETHLAQLVGRYTHRCRRDAAGAWRVAYCRLDVVGYPTGRAPFERAFALARARHAGRA